MRTGPEEDVYVLSKYGQGHAIVDFSPRQTRCGVRSSGKIVKCTEAQVMVYLIDNLCASCFGGTWRTRRTK